MLTGFCFAAFFGFTALFSHVHTLHVFHLCFVPVLFSFVLFGVFLLMLMLAYLEWNPRPSGLEYSASTNHATT
jgi:hypothetical protein